MTQPTLSWTRADFGDDFLFGTATSAYQVEGHGSGGAGPTHWDTFAATPGNVKNGENGALACDHYHRWAEDLDLIAGAGFDVYRFSSSWARVLPEGRGRPNTQGLDFYDRLIDGLLERGIKPALTLYHWDLPAALADLGGWRNRDIADWFTDYALLMGERFGDRLFSLATINEFWCVSWLSHFWGEHAPGLRDIRATARAHHHVLLAHGQAIRALREAGQTNLGAVFNLEAALPADPSPEASAAAARYDAIYNRSFLEPAFHGSYPDLVLKGLAPHLPQGWQDDMSVIQAPLDWVGINYYTCKRILPAPGPWPGFAETPGPLPKTAMGWEIYPLGLGDFLIRVARDYTGALPLIVTENGMASPHAPDDHERIAYFDAHLADVQRARAEGVPVHGYYAWSLMDNFEWAWGYGARFGLVEIDFDSLERRPKASYHAFRQALSQP